MTSLFIGHCFIPLVPCQLTQTSEAAFYHTITSGETTKDNYGSLLSPVSVLTPEVLDYSQHPTDTQLIYCTTFVCKY